MTTYVFLLFCENFEDDDKDLEPTENLDDDEDFMIASCSLLLKYGSSAGKNKLLLFGQSISQ